MSEFIWALGQVLLFGLYLFGGLTLLVMILFVIRILIELIKYKSEQ